MATMRLSKFIILHPNRVSKQVRNDVRRSVAGLRFIISILPNLHLLIVLLQQLHALVHVVKVDSEVFQSLNSGFVAEEFGNGLYVHACVVESASEGPSQVVVAKVEPYLLPQRVQDGIVETAGVLLVVAYIGVFVVVAPQEQVSRVSPVWDVLLGDFYDSRPLVQPSVQNCFGLPVEADGSVLAVASAFPSDVHVGFGPSVHDIVQGETAALGVPQAHAEFEVYHDILKSGLFYIHEGLVLVLFEPVRVHPHVLGEHNPHILDDRVPVVFEISLQVVDLPLDVGVEVSFGAIVFDNEQYRIGINLVRRSIESSCLEDSLGTLKAPSAFVLGVLLGTLELGFNEFPDAAVG